MGSFKAGDSDQASIEVKAPPEKVYELVSDVTRMGEWSPETTKCEWIGGATGPAVGARFKGRNKAAKGPAWTTKPEVVAAEPAREFAFSRTGPGVGEVVWRYRMEPAAGGTRLTESYEIVKPAMGWMDWLTLKMTGVPDRRADLHKGMETTIGRIKAAAEGSVA